MRGDIMEADKALLMERVRAYMFSLENPTLIGESSLVKRGFPLLSERIEIATTSLCPHRWWKPEGSGEHSIGWCKWLVFKTRDAGAPASFYCSEDSYSFIHDVLLGDGELSGEICIGMFLPRTPYLIAVPSKEAVLVDIASRLARDKLNPLYIYDMLVIYKRGIDYDVLKRWIRRCGIGLSLIDSLKSINDIVANTGFRLARYIDASRIDWIELIALIENSIMEVHKEGTMVIALDRDGTVETGEPPGPISREHIYKLIERGHIVYAYGNSKLVYDFSLPYARGETKAQRLNWLRERYPYADRYIVVDNEEVMVNGWEWFSPDRFLEFIGEKS